MNYTGKITAGHVVQVFDNYGECAEQHFVAGDNVEFVASEGCGFSRGFTESLHHPFDMVQPEER